jgi:hypothetical protein
MAAGVTAAVAARAGPSKGGPCGASAATLVGLVAGAGAGATAVAVALVAALTSPVARGADAAPGPMAGPWDMIAFEVKSWGRPVTSWRLLADGSGSWTETVEAQGERAPRPRAVWHEVEAGVAGFGRIAGEYARVGFPAPDPQVCVEFLPDLPYGTLRLTRGASTVEIDWNSGCLDAQYQTFIQTLKAADTIVAGWGRAGRVLRTEALEPAR